MSESFSSPLAHYLAGMTRSNQAATPSQHLERGGACVQPADLLSLHSLLPALQAKAARLGDSRHFRARLALLVRFLEEAPAGEPTPAQREALFALAYFLKGADLIPDFLPEIGLLDDALIVETAVRRNHHELAAHWAARGRTWPADV